MRRTAKRVTAVSCLVLGLGVTLTATAVQPENAPPRQPGRQPGQGRPPGEGGQPRGEGQRRMSVEAAMMQMNRAFGQLEESIGDPEQKGESLMAVWAIERASASSKMAPPHEGTTPEQLEQFQRGQIELMETLLELETAILDGDADACMALMEEIADIRDDAHEHFGVEMHEEEDENEVPQNGGGGGR